MNGRTPSHLTSIVLAAIVVASIVGPALTLTPWVALFAVVSLGVLWCDLVDRPLTTPWLRIGLVAAGFPFFALGDVQVGAAGLACAGLVVTQLGRDRGLCLGLAFAVAALTLATEPSRAVTALAVLACTVALAGGIVLSRTDFGTATLARTRVPGHPVRDALRAAAAPTVGILAVSLGVFLLLPQPDPLVRQNPVAAASGLGGGGGSRPMGGYVGGPMSLNNRGDLPDVPIVEVPAESPRLWRVSVLDAYSGQGWSPVTGRSQSLWPAGERDRTYPVEPLRGYRGEVPAPGALVEVMPGAAQRDGFRVVNYVRDTFQVTVGSYGEVGSSEPGIPAGDAVDDPADPRWTALPESVTDRTRSLAQQVTGGNSDPVAASRAISAYLTSGDYRYDLDAPVAPAGRDSVDHFLFDSRSGFCEHYASAETVMLRSLGIPARVAVGYAGGSDDGDVRTIRGTQAHAWVEVYVAGRGWVTSDPTPAAEPGLADLLTGRQAQLLLGVLLVLGALVGLLFWLRRDRRPAPVVPEPEPTDATALALKRLRAAMRVAGVPTYPGQTLAEMGRLLPYLAEELQIVERQLYGGAPVSQLELQASLEALDRATASLLALSGEEAGARESGWAVAR